MDLLEKLAILADAAKYDVACTSSGLDRHATKGLLGSTTSAGICHSFAADGRCITLLKVLMTNVCVYDCAYCVNRCSNEVPRAAFTPEELCDLTIAFFRRNYIEGLFLSSGVIGCPDRTMELMIQTLELLRYREGFRGYVHAKAVPGASPELVEQLGLLADRLSVNLELPSRQSLKLLAPQKSRDGILAPMKQIADGIEESREELALARRRAKGGQLARRTPSGKRRAFAPAGQSTQMIIGATPETDYHILSLSASLYKTMGLKRVFFSAYLPVNQDPRLPSTPEVQLNREHRLYQADWLMRFYKFEADEVISSRHPMLDLDVDPKAAWALGNMHLFPVEVNTADYEMLLRVPGVGVVGAKKIMRARKTCCLRESELKKIGIAYKRARYFITCNGVYQGSGVPFDPASVRAQIAAPIEGGRHGRRAARQSAGQMRLFEEAGASWNLMPQDAAVPALQATDGLPLLGREADCGDVS